MSCVKDDRLLTSEVQWGNQICDEGAVALGRGLSLNNSLRELDLVSRTVACVHSSLFLRQQWHWL